MGSRGALLVGLVWVCAPLPALGLEVAAAKVSAPSPAAAGIPVEPLAPPEGPPAPPAAEESKPAPKELPTLEISGVLSVLYNVRLEADDDGQTSPSKFRLNKGRVQFQGKVTDWAGYTLQIDPRSPTILGVVRDAYLSFWVIPRHELRIGQQKTQFGWENRESSTRLYTITRSELAESLARGFTLRDLGVGLVGKVPLSHRFRLEDAVTLVNGNGFGMQEDDTPMKNVWGRIGLRYNAPGKGNSLRLGLSGAAGDQMSEADPGPPPEPSVRFQFRRAGADFELEHRWAFFVAEIAHGWDELPANSGEIEESTAWFVELVSKTPWHVGTVVRYDEWDAEEFRRLTLGAYWGERKAPLRVLSNLEFFEDEAGRHDHRLLTMAQARF